MAAAEKASKIREVKKLNDDRKVLTQNLETTRTRSNDLEAELRMARDDLSKTSRALEVTRRMFGALAEEKNVEQQKALALASRVSKLESKLGLSISQTGLAKKNAALRDNLRSCRSNVLLWQQKYKGQEDDLIRACSEIKVLSRALQVAQDSLDVQAGPSTGSLPSGDPSPSPRPGGGGRGEPLREKLLYQLALRKEEAHNLALELAHKTKAMRSNETEISNLMENIRNQKIAASADEASVRHLTGQLMEYDVEMRKAKGKIKKMEEERTEMLGNIERMGGENASLAREVTRACREKEEAEERAGGVREE
ncbi:hypothetical protein TrRE_jg3137, partial [Triparma retinervis]